VLVRDGIEDLGAAIRELAGGAGADIVYDGSVSVLRGGGTFVTYGYARGHIPPISLWEQPHGVRLVTVRGAAEQPAEWREGARQVMRWIEVGTPDILIGST
jgi:NADPH:quinone reductase